MLIAASVPGMLLRVLLGALAAIVVTVLALRLLGIRRGWVTALLAGSLGWGVTIIVALGVNHWNWGADGLVLHLLAIGIPTTMAVAVAFDLLARPGSLAIGERAGLVVATRPGRAVRKRISVMRRYRELLRLARREGFGPFQSTDSRAERTAESEAVRLRRVLEAAGGVYIKLGQIAATRVDLLPGDVCEELSRLQQHVPPESRERVAEVLEAELGPDFESNFSDFEWEPLAAASIGQTHLARLRTGEAVVVKVQRPGIRETMERDLAALGLIADLAQRRTPFGRGIRSGDILEQFAQSLRYELDFRREADAMEEMAHRLDRAAGVRVPVVYRQLCTRRLLVQERFEGRTVADAGGLDDMDADRPALADKLVRSTLDQIITVGFFHADPHPGNVFVLADGSLGLIDFGATGRLDALQQNAIRDIFYAMAQRDVRLLRDGVEQVTQTTEATSPDDLERALARLLAEHVRPGASIDPRVMQELVTTLARFGLQLPADIVLLSRALATLDGTLRVLCPGRSLMTAFTELLQSADDPLVDHDAMIRTELMSALPRLRKLPEQVDRILTLTGRGELKLRTIVDEDSRRIVRTLVNRALLAGIGAILLLVSVLLLVSPDAGPAVADRTGLFDIFGYGGLLAGVVLVLRVVAAVARDGTT
ncbi:MAG: ubiquinone biosynthesis protein [Ilumatobacteraceae bacterium]